MIDLHTHILPNIDDGARNKSEALKMIELLSSQGVSGAVCTPHYYSTKMPLDEFIYRRDKAMGLLKESKIPLILASETYLHESLLYYSDLEPLKIDNTNYLLFELPYERKWKDSLYSTLKSLIYQFDVIPIIAHIERYKSINKKHISKLKELGCFIQLNTSSLLDENFKNKSLSYIKNELIDVLGSDCHNLNHRPPEIQLPLEEIRRRLGNRYCNELMEQSEKIVRGF